MEKFKLLLVLLIVFQNILILNAQEPSKEAISELLENAEVNVKNSPDINHKKFGFSF